MNPAVVLVRNMKNLDIDIIAGVLPYLGAKNIICLYMNSKFSRTIIRNTLRYN